MRSRVQAQLRPFSRPGFPSVDLPDYFSDCGPSHSAAPFQGHRKGLRSARPRRGTKETVMFPNSVVKGVV